MSWKNLVSQIAPTIGTAIGGPLGGMAINMICNALGLPSNSSETDIEKQLSANPEKLLELKKSEIEFQKRLAELDIDIEKIHSADRDSARKREMEIRDKTPALLSFLTTVGFFGTLILMLFNGTPAHGGEAMLVMLGALGSGWGATLQYYFGSSSGSQQKNNIIANRDR